MIYSCVFFFRSHTVSTIITYSVSIPRKKRPNKTIRDTHRSCEITARTYFIIVAKVCDSVACQDKVIYSVGISVLEESHLSSRIVECVFEIVGRAMKSRMFGVGDDDGWFGGFF